MIIGITANEQYYSSNSYPFKELKIVADNATLWGNGTLKRLVRPIYLTLFTELNYALPQYNITINYPYSKVSFNNIPFSIDAFQINPNGNNEVKIWGNYLLPSDNIYSLILGE